MMAAQRVSGIREKEQADAKRRLTDISGRPAEFFTYSLINSTTAIQKTNTTRRVLPWEQLTSNGVCCNGCSERGVL